MPTTAAAHPQCSLKRFKRGGKIFLPAVMACMEVQMDAAQIQTTLVEVLQNIQATSELECPPLGGATKPIEELPKFDSKIWPVAIGMLGVKLGINIANDVNIFRQDDSSIALTIDEIVAKVAALVDAQAVVEPKQANAQ